MGHVGHGSQNVTHCQLCFWSGDNEGGHTIESAIPENSVIYANVMAPCFIEQAFSTFFAHVTLTLTR